MIVQEDKPSQGLEFVRVYPLVQMHNAMTALSKLHLLLPFTFLQFLCGAQKLQKSKW
jgi:hypothetical protein